MERRDAFNIVIVIEYRRKNDFLELDITESGGISDAEKWTSYEGERTWVRSRPTN